MGFLDKMVFFQFEVIPKLFQTFQNLMLDKTLFFSYFFLLPPIILLYQSRAIRVTIGKSNEDPTNDCAAKLYTSSGL